MFVKWFLGIFWRMGKHKAYILTVSTNVGFIICVSLRRSNEALQPVKHKQVNLYILCMPEQT